MGEPFDQRVVGKWHDILPAIGISSTFLTGKNCPCPMCGGKDRFRFLDTEGRGTWVCNVCGGGTGIHLVQRKFRVDFKGMADMIEPHIEKAKVKKPKAMTDEEKHHEMNVVWRCASTITEHTPAWRYLKSRCGLLSSIPRDLRSRQSLWFGDSEYHPAMLAMVRDAKGKPVNIHRTYITKEGQKIERRIMAGKVPKGSAIRLAEPTDELGVAEGIETALSAAALFKVPVWATLGTVGMSSWEPPPGIKRIFIFADNDAKYGGQAAAYALAHRLACLDDPPEIRIEFPSQPGTDWNDVHQEIGVEKF